MCNEACEAVRETSCTLLPRKTHRKFLLIILAYVYVIIMCKIISCKVKIFVIVVAGVSIAVAKICNVLIREFKTCYLAEIKI